MRSDEVSERVEYPEVTLAVIAGGRGSRLGGVAKGLLEVEGRPVLERVLVLGGLCGDVLLVANEPGPYARWGLRAVADVVHGRGAPGGVHAALVGAHTEWVLAVACDMPFVTREVARVLLGARAPGVDAVAFTVAGRVEPLLALYHRALARPWGEALESGEPSLRALLALSRARLLPEEALRAVDPALRAVVGVNTPEDLARHGVSLPPAEGGS
ncbi:Formate dehydrogenase chain D [Cystobacter fuscus DSM 2262]|uniref:Probable molybdenum cofactor guanylyltransferase n=1 Tax=Cystobacter fuscus (strain ATCC 25194 / DSM 2262 / NBRC 100088 / M29) TaxID=1242864 RepID=S9PHR5_CYSF2|nr:molybdenum cofactor guanylyltransferase [Cystobacter fuscus]EPX63880.1 Formate dehydrogenase chain D [Cystobacter fuscus DSM 2262]